MPNAPAMPREIRFLKHLLKRSKIAQELIVRPWQDLESIFRDNPHLFIPCAIYSEDKRTSNGWYLGRPGLLRPDSSWVVGYFPGGPQQSFEDPAEACTEFVHREIG